MFIRTITREIRVPHFVYPCDCLRYHNINVDALHPRSPSVQGTRVPQKRQHAYQFAKLHQLLPVPIIPGCMQTLQLFLRTRVITIDNSTRRFPPLLLLCVHWRSVVFPGKQFAFRSVQRDAFDFYQRANTTKQLLILNDFLRQLIILQISQFRTRRGNLTNPLPDKINKLGSLINVKVIKLGNSNNISYFFLVEFNTFGIEEGNAHNRIRDASTNECLKLIEIRLRVRLRPKYLINDTTYPLLISEDFLTVDKFLQGCGSGKQIANSDIAAVYGLSVFVQYLHKKVQLCYLRSQQDKNRGDLIKLID